MQNKIKKLTIWGIALITIFNFFNLGAFAFGIITAQYTLKVTDFKVTKKDSQEACIQNVDCKISVTIEKAGTGTPANNKISLKINEDIIKNNNDSQFPLDGTSTLGSSALSITYTFPHTLKFGADEKKIVVLFFDGTSVIGDTYNTTYKAAAAPAEPTKPPSFSVTVPPSFDITIPKEEDGSGKVVNKIKILNADAFPKGFNPKLGKTKISYEVTLKAKIDVKMIDHTGQTVAVLIDNQAVDAGKYYVEWNGTKTNQTGGELVTNGTYKFKVDAKNQESGAIEDTAQGDVSVIYPANQPENPSSVTTKTPSSSSGSTQTSATMAVQNSQSGNTAATGPDALIYILFPIAGYIFSRRRRGHCQKK